MEKDRKKGQEFIFYYCVFAKDPQKLVSENVMYIRFRGIWLLFPVQ